MSVKIECDECYETIEQHLGADIIVCGKCWENVKEPFEKEIEELEAEIDRQESLLDKANLKNNNLQKEIEELKEEMKEMEIRNEGV